jgi:spartin
MSAHNEPRLLFNVPGVKAYHIQHGVQECLTPNGGQTLSLLMVPTSSPFAGLSVADPQSAAPEEDYYLHLHLPPELDLPLPATTQVYHQPPHSYLIPRWDLGPDSGAFTRIELSENASQEDIDTMESILGQATSFMERASPPKGGYSKEQDARDLPPYDPSTYKPGESYAPGSSSANVGGQIVLIDEENGSVVGELGDGFHVVEDSKVEPGSKGMLPPHSNWT